VTARLFVTGAVVLLVGACVSPSPSLFSEYYYDQTGGVDITTYPVIDLSRDEPKLYLRTDVEQDIQSMLENGYILVGYSSFNAANIDESGAVAQARKVRASVVLTYSHYTDTVSEEIPFTQPDIQASTTQLRSGVFGSGGYAAYSGNAVRRSDYLATYWVKLKPPIFGTRLDDLTAEMSKQLGANTGMLVQAVIKDSPAFRAGLQKGDILYRIGLVGIDNNKAYEDALKIYRGELVNVVIYRDGKEISKQIQLGVPR